MIQIGEMIQMWKVYLDLSDSGFCYRVASGPNKGTPAITIHTGFGSLKQNIHGQLITSEELDYKLVDGPEPDVPNMIELKSRCGQSQKENISIDADQSITSVTVRGVKYRPE